MAKLVSIKPAAGPQPLHGAVATHLAAPSPHWLVVSHGFTELWDKESDDPDVSGFGFELTCRIPGAEAKLDFGWVLQWMQDISSSATSKPLVSTWTPKARRERLPSRHCLAAVLSKHSRPFQSHS